MRLLIDQVWGRIGLHQQSPFLRLEISDPPLKLYIEPPVLTVKPDRVELKIDARECRADLNMYDLTEFAQKYAEQAKGDVAQAIAATAAEGDRLAAIENGEENVFANVARENSTGPEVSVELVPANLPRIEFQVIPGQNNFQEGFVRVEKGIGETRVELEEGNVDVYLRQHPELRITAVGSLVDLFG